MIHTLTFLLRFLINIIQWLRRLFYQLGFFKENALPGYVISVGNIEFGGTGKTPLVLHIIEGLTAKGFRSVVLTRGYGSSLKKNEYAIMLDGKVVFGTKTQNCDEPLMISRKNPTVPVVIGSNRVMAASRFLDFMKDYQPTHWILDDGFQHQKIKRDFDICLITADVFDSSYWIRPFTREFLFAKSNADLVLVTKSKTKTVKANRCDFSIDLIYNVASGEPLNNYEEVALFAGIANPDFLLYQLGELGIHVKHKVIVKDHATVSKETFKDLARHGLPILMTEKDFFRQEADFSNSGANIFLVRQKLHVDEVLFDKIYGPLKG